MKNFYIYFLFTLTINYSNIILGQTLNEFCESAYPICAGSGYNYPAGVNTGTAQTGPDYGCLFSQPNPAWYYLHINNPGNISLSITTSPQRDVDFICYGPFTSTVTPCYSELTNNGITGNYPTGNTVDCSYDASYQEWCNIPNTQSGQYYLLLITNYSNQPCNILLNQIPSGYPPDGSVYCEFIANVTGNFFHDQNGNGVRDVNEAGVPACIAYTPGCNYSISDSNGDYNGYVCNMPDTVWGHSNFPYSVVSPLYNIANASPAIADFAVSFPDSITDVSLTLTELTPARPGFNYLCDITVSNQGTINTCGTLTLTFDTIFSYVSSNPPPDNIAGNIITWNNVCLNVLQSSDFTARFLTYSTTPQSTVYRLYAQFSTFLPDTTPSNNLDSIRNVVVGSFDPNDKQASPEGLITNAEAFAQKEIIYTVRFQNTGTYMATNIRIADSISILLQVTSITFLSSSHPCTYSLYGNNLLQFYFNNINLPDENNDEPGSHGFVKFKLKCKPLLGYGGEVRNNAYIYFDYNQPIVTNTTLTYTETITTVQPDKKIKEKHIVISPNPAHDIVYISGFAGNEQIEINISDNSGKTVLKTVKTAENGNAEIDISTLLPGVYNLNINPITIGSKNISVNEKLIVL